MQSFDAIVIGGGTNGLACAARLAGAGRTVIVLEAGPAAGGGAATHEFAPGYHVSGLAHILNMLDPRVVKAMALKRHGLKFANANLASTALEASGNHLVLQGPVGEGIIGDLSPVDRQAWAELRHRLLAFSAALAPFRQMTPPRLARGNGNQMLKLARLGFGIRALGRDEFREFLRMILINVADVLDDDLSDNRLKGLLSFDAVLGAWTGPRSPNSLILMLNRMAGEIEGRQAALAIPAGGMGMVADAMQKSAIAAGVTLRTDTSVASIFIEDDRAAGVTLENGEVIKAPLVVSAINPKTTFQKLVGPRYLDTGFLRRITAIRSRGGAAKLHLALNAKPDFRGADLQSRLVIAPSVRAVEDAFNAVKYGEVPKQPVMEIIVPTAFESGLAPQGHQTISAIVQFAPDVPKAGMAAARKAMLKNALAVLQEHSPGIGKTIVHAELLMPYDIEARFGMVGGNWHHGELAVERMFFLRPAIGLAQYQTPLAGLWLAGAGSHPGGGISGASGWNAAGRIIGEVRS